MTPAAVSPHSVSVLHVFVINDYNGSRHSHPERKHMALTI